MSGPRWSVRVAAPVAETTLGLGASVATLVAASVAEPLLQRVDLHQGHVATGRQHHQHHHLGSDREPLDQLGGEVGEELAGEGILMLIYALEAGKGGG